MHITIRSEEIKNGAEFYCYLKSASGAIAEAVGPGFIRTIAKAILKLHRTGGQPSAPTEGKS